MNLDSEEILLFLNQSISDIYIKTDLNGAIIEASDSIFSNLSYDVNKIKTTLIHDICATPGNITDLYKQEGATNFYIQEIPFLDINSNWVFFNLKALKKETAYYFILKNVNESILFREANKFSAERIKVSEKRYKKLFNIVNTGIILFDPESSNVLDFNENTLSILNYNKYNFNSLKVFDLIDSNDLHQTNDIFNGKLTELTTVIKFRTSTNQLLQAKVFISRFNLGGNDVIEFVLEDLTPIIESEKEINEREKYLELITEIQAYFLWNNYSFNTSQELIEIINHSLKLDRIFIYSFKIQGSKLTGTLIAENKNKKLDNINLSDHTIELIIDNSRYDRKAYFKDEFVQSDNFNSKEANLKEANSIALYDDGKEILVLGYSNHTDHTRWNTSLLNTINSIASIVNLSFERKTIVNQLFSSEKKYREIVEEAKDLIFTTDVNGKFNYVNPICITETGFSDKELLEKHYYDLICLDNKQKALSFYEHQFKSRLKSTIYEFPILTKSKKKKWLELSLKSIESPDGNIIGYSGVARDVTDKILGLEKIQDSENRLNFLFENSNDATVWVSKKGTLLKANKNSYKLFGFRSNIGFDKLKNFIEPIIKSNKKDSISQTLKAKKGLFESTVINSKNVSIPVEVNFNSSKTNNETVYQIFLRDITERKKSQDEVLLREKYLRFIAELELYFLTADDINFQTIVNHLGVALPDVGKISFHQKPHDNRVSYYSSEKAKENLKVNLISILESTDSNDWKEELQVKKKTIFKTLKTDLNVIVDVMLVPIFLRNKYEGFLSFVNYTEEKKWSNIEIDFINTSALAISIFIERQKIVEELEYSENLYRSVVDSLEEGLIVQNSDGNIQAINKRAEQILGLNKDQMMGKTSLDPMWNCIHEDGTDYPGENHPIPQTLKTGEPIYHNIMGVHKPDNTLTWIKINSVPVLKDENDKVLLAVATFTDITQEKLMNDQLVKSEDKFKNMYNLSPVGILTVNEGGMIISANKYLETLLDYNEGELLEETIDVLYPEKRGVQKHHNHIKNYFQKASTRQMAEDRRTIPVKSKNGDLIPSEITLNHFTSGNENFTIVLIRDVGDKAEAEEAKKSLQEKELLLKEIHHRVKNNMQIISSLLSLQEKLIQDPQAREKYAESKSRIRSMALIHEKLYQSTNLMDIDVKDYVLSLSRYLIDTYSVSQFIKVKLDVDQMILDIDRAIPCGLILNELITNSLKYAFIDFDSGGEIKVFFKKENGVICFGVEDNGTGIPKEVNVFNNKSLGMKLVKTLASQIDGEINIDSKIGIGTQIQISFNEN